MAKLFFFHSVMNAGKTSILLNVRYTYMEHGDRVMVFTSAADDRSGIGKIRSRSGGEAEAHALVPEDNVFELVREAHEEENVAAVLVDEVQFLTPEQIRQMSDIADYLDIPVMAYGLMNNAYGKLFSPAVETLLALADQFDRIKQICHCGRKATMILKYNADGSVVRDGEVVETGGESRYVSVCRRHWKSGDIGRRMRKAVFDAGFGPKVVCMTCNTKFPVVFDDIEQGDGCAAKLIGNTVSGYFGSAVADGCEHRFVGPVPQRARQGVICDECLRGFIAEGSLERVYGLFEDEEFEVVSG
jgi:thymidine kinase|nr:thymidine kinase [Neorhizobium tomejilense]